VLWAEPNDEARSAAVDLLDRCGVAACAVADLREAWARVAPGPSAEAFEVVVYAEPVSPGVDLPFAQRVLELDPGNRPKLIKLVSQKELASLDAGARALVDGWIPKPITRSALEAALLETVLEIAGDGQAASGGERPAPKSDVRVLLVEDNPDNCAIASEMLRLLGCTVIIAADGLEAVEQFVRAPFDVVLMDCQIPGIDGFEVTRRIRGIEHVRAAVDIGRPAQRATIIALTANAMSGDRERCLATGMDDYLSKPYSRSELHAVLQRWIGERMAMPIAETAAASIF
jgi:CheY-like chemotaxis protein